MMEPSSTPKTSPRWQKRQLLRYKADTARKKHHSGSVDHRIQSEVSSVQLQTGTNANGTISFPMEDEQMDGEESEPELESSDAVLLNLCQ